MKTRRWIALLLSAVLLFICSSPGASAAQALKQTGDAEESETLTDLDLVSFGDYVAQHGGAVDPKPQATIEISAAGFSGKTGGADLDRCLGLGVYSAAMLGNIIAEADQIQIGERFGFLGIPGLLKRLGGRSPGAGADKKQNSTQQERDPSPCFHTQPTSYAW